jgi:hypothetical protein
VWNMFWKMKVTGKVKIIAWRLINDGLTTRQQGETYTGNSCDV